MFYGRNFNMENYTCISHDIYPNSVLARTIVRNIIKSSKEILLKDNTTKVSWRQYSFVIALFYSLSYYYFSKEMLASVKKELTNTLSEQEDDNNFIIQHCEEYFKQIIEENPYLISLYCDNSDNQLLCLSKLSNYAVEYLYETLNINEINIFDALKNYHLIFKSYLPKEKPKEFKPTNTTKSTNETKIKFGIEISIVSNIIKSSKNFLSIEKITKETWEQYSFILALFYTLSYYSFSQDLFDKIKKELSNFLTKQEKDNGFIYKRCEEYFKIIIKYNPYLITLNNENKDKQILLLSRLSDYANKFIFDNFQIISPGIYDYIKNFYFKSSKDYILENYKELTESLNFYFDPTKNLLVYPNAKKGNKSKRNVAKIRKRVNIISIIIMASALIGFIIFFVVNCSNGNKTTNLDTNTSTSEPSSEVNNEIELIDITDYVDPGDKAYIEIKGEPYTTYDITVTYNSGESTAGGLYSKETDSDGYVSWSWKVGTKTESGTYDIEISNYYQTKYFEFTVN